MAIYSVSFMKRLAQKLRRSIQFHYGETENAHVHDFQISGRVHDSQKTTLFIFGDTGTLQIIQENNIFQHNLIGNLTASDIGHFEKFGTDGARQIPKTRLIAFF